MTGRCAEAGALLLLGWVAAGPLSTWFAGREWTAKSPAAALFAWQAIALSAGCAVLTAELTFAIAAVPGSWPAALWTLAADPERGGAYGVCGLALFAVTACWLLVVLAQSFVTAQRSRTRHRLLVNLIGRDELAGGTSVALLDSPTPVAYAIPGRHPRVVLTSGVRDRLDEHTVRSVIAHEQAHLRGRHALLVQPFVAWQRSLPALAAAAGARRRVEELAEYVCDDAAVRATDAATVRRALTTLVDPGRSLIARVGRVGHHSKPLLCMAVILGAVLLAFLPPVLVVVFG